MSLYLDQSIAQENVNSPGQHVKIEWHSKFHILAVVSNKDEWSSEVTLFREEGETSLQEPIFRKGAKVESLGWHPNKRFLALGWSDGELMICNETERNAAPQSFKVCGDSAINFIGWSSEGSRLMLCDETAQILVYRVDLRGLIQGTPFSRNRLESKVQCFVLKPPLAPDTDGKDSRSGTAASRASRTGGEVFTDSLDTLQNRRTHSALKLGPTESSTFFFGLESGEVFCLRESGNIQESFNVTKSILAMLFYKERSTLLTLTQDLLLTQHSIQPDCSAQETSQIKLSGKLKIMNLIWTCTGVLALATGENVVRLWDIEHEESEILTLDTQKGYTHNDNINCIAYNCNSDLLAAGTEMGCVAMWKRQYRSSEGSESHWRLQVPATFEESISRVEWSCSYGGLLAICMSKNVLILQEQIMAAAYNKKMLAIQTGTDAISVCRIDPLNIGELRPQVAVKGIAISEERIATWNGKHITVSELSGEDFVTQSNFEINSNVIAMYSQNIYEGVGDKINVRNLQGTVKQIITTPEEEGAINSMHVNESFLAVGTGPGYLRVYDLSRREARQIHHTKSVGGSLEDFSSLLSVRVNCAGNKLSFLYRRADGTLSTKLHVWDVETDTVFYFNFLSGKTDQQELEKDSTDNQERQYYTYDILFRNPVSHFWDSSDPRYLLAESALLPVTSQSAYAGNSRTSTLSSASSKSSSSGSKAENLVSSFFVAMEIGIMLQDSFIPSEQCERLVAVDVPYLYFTIKPGEVAAEREDETKGLERLISATTIQRICRDFVGLDSVDATTKSAMMDFSFYVTSGNMDEAFKAIKLIKTESVWEHMATMCVKTGRLDVASVCLGNMGSARSAMALRECINEEPKVQLAVLAVELGLLEDAERFLKSSKRYDLLTKFYESCNNWKKALDTAESQDRIHLRHTCYGYAQYLESIGAIQGAIEHYEKSDTHKFEVPRMLFDNPAILEKYVSSSQDEYLSKWWAQHLESLGEIDQALDFYKQAKDYFSIVRLYCFVDDYEKAAQVVSESKDRAAAYHLARYCENKDMFREAVKFFGKAQATSSAIRLCKEQRFDDQIAQLALMGSESDMIEAAKYYEDKTGFADKAVMLYHKAGLFGRALDLAFRTEQFSALDLIASDLNHDSDPRVLERCAEFFMQNHRYDKAVQLLAYAKKFPEAIDLCIRKNVTLTEQTAESLTPTKKDVTDSVQRTKLLEQLADCCMQQGLYHIAAKKYTQSGNKTEAMRALVKSGDTDTIIRFASRAGSKETKIQIMAGNYLQTADWKTHSQMIRKFYHNAGASMNLASFLEGLAQSAIDDNRDYTEAIKLLKEAEKVLSEARGQDQNQIDNRKSKIDRKIETIQQYTESKKLYETDPAEALKRLQELTKDKSNFLILGDVYTMLIEHNVRKNNIKRAKQYLDELQSDLPDIVLGNYLNEDILKSLLNEDPGSKHSVETLKDTEDADFIPEAISLTRKLKESNAVEDNDWLNL